MPKDRKDIISYIHLHKTYFISAVILVAMIIVLVFVVGANRGTSQDLENDTQNASTQTEIETEQNYALSGNEYEPAKEFEINAYPELNELITRYFQAYINADIATLETIVSPLTEMEKSYLSEMSRFYEEYRDITVYSKPGLTKGSYIASVSFQIKFYEKEQLAPSMMLFYVQTREDGSLYIDNLYSDFNLRYSELQINTDVYKALVKYTTQTDYLELSSAAETAFNNIIKENSEIYQLTKREIPAARQKWEETVYYVAFTEPGPPETENGQDTQVVPEGDIQNGQDTQIQEPANEDIQNTQIPEEQVPVVQKVRAIATDVNIRSSASTESQTIGKMNAGEVFVKLSVEGDWTKIEYNGGTGFIKSEFLEDVIE